MLSNVWKCWKYQKSGKGMWWNVIKCHQKCDQMLDLKCDQMWLKMWENVIKCHQMSKNVGKCDWNVTKRFPDKEPADQSHEGKLGYSQVQYQVIEPGVFSLLLS
jgi:hypothetical protein